MLPNVEAGEQITVMKAKSFRINAEEASSLNDAIDCFIKITNDANILNGPRSSRQVIMVPINQLTMDNITCSKELVKYVCNNIRSKACEGNADRLHWMRSGMETRLKSMISIIQSVNDDGDKVVKKVRLDKPETPQEKLERLEKEKCKLMREKHEASEREKEEALLVQRRDLIIEVKEMQNEINGKLITTISERDVDLIKNFYQSLENLRVRMINHNNHDRDIATLYNEVLLSLKTLYRLGYSRKWEWAVELRKLQDDIIHREAAIIMVPESKSRSNMEIAYDTTINYSDRREAFSKISTASLDSFRRRKDRINVVANGALEYLSRYDESRKNQVQIFEEESTKFSNNNGKRMYEAIDNGNREDVNTEDMKRKLQAEHENLKKLISLVEISVNKIQELDPLCISTKPTFFGAFSCDTTKNLDVILEPITENQNKITLTKYLNQIFLSMFGMKSVKLIMPRKKQSNHDVLY